uniref:Uncharacterized protein n=1 Tax=Globisporangium ultimum (strain ATCC 200006 / CBS 805.95 / DAOM BR144) TaxID=431595 RepID=K3WWL3_GLOUD
MSLSCTGLACFIGVFASCLNQGILRELLDTFDFGFVSIQVSLAHLCACDILSWDGRCLVICAS